MIELARKKSIRYFAAALMAIVALMLTGCGASVSFSEQTDGGVRYAVYELSVDKPTLDAMERGAAEINGKKYGVAEYLKSVFTEFGYDTVSSHTTEDGYYVKYRKAIDDAPELYAVGTPVAFETTVKDNLFIKNVRATSPDPFNGLRAYYDGIAADSYDGLAARLKNGRLQDGSIVFPSLEQAFPIIKTADPSALELNYVRNGSKRMKSNGTAKQIDGKTAEYTFTRYFDASDMYIAFEYKRPSPIGWYLVATAAGGITLAVLLAVAHRLKRKNGKNNVETAPQDNGDTDNDPIETGEKNG